MRTAAFRLFVMRSSTLVVFGALVLCSQAPAKAQLQGALFQDIASAIEHMNIEVAKQVQTAADIAQKQLAIEQVKGELADKTAAVAQVVERETQLDEIKKAEQASRVELRNRIADTADKIKADVDTKLGFYKTAFVVLTGTSVLMALVAAIAGFMNFSKIAGICSLITTAALVLPNAFGVRDKLNFFQYCSSQSYALSLQARLPPQPSVDDVAAWQKRISQLMDIISNPPKEQDPESWTNRLIK